LQILSDLIILSLLQTEINYDKGSTIKSIPLYLKFASALPCKWAAFQTAPDIDEPPFQFIDHTMDLSVVDTMLHGSPDLVIHRTEIWAVWRPQVGRNARNFGVS